MDPRLLQYYNIELQHLREMGAEFAQQFPKVAARLGMNGLEVSDPYVERLLEGVGFLAARVHLKLDSEFPRFTQSLLEIIYPHYLAPTPSMVVVQCTPDANDPNLATGFTLPRGSSMQSTIGADDVTACEFRTAQEVELWPIEVVSANYFSYAPDLPLASLPSAQRIKGGVRIRLRTSAALKFSQTRLQRLRFYMAGRNDVANQLYELCTATCLGALILPAKAPPRWHEVLPAESIRPVGFDDDDAVLPATQRSFQGYRLLQEYFSFPQRFRFFDLSGLAPAISRVDGNELEIVLLFGRGDAALEAVVDASNFALYCTPAVNLFPKRADRIHVDDTVHEYHVVPDRTRPLDFEVYQVAGLTGFSAGSDGEREFRPFYSAFSVDSEHEDSGYFTVRREPRLLTTEQRRKGVRSSYIGSEAFVALVDAKHAPFADDLRQLSVQTLCTNRDLVLQLPVGIGRTDFTFDQAAPVERMRVVTGPSRPYGPLADGAIAWRAISHLATNYLSLIDASPQEGAAALRETLDLYAPGGDASVRRQIEGIRSVGLQRVVRRLPPAPEDRGGSASVLAFGRGLEITLELDEMAFEGGSAYVMGSVLEQYFARYVSLNSFTETALRSTRRGGDQPMAATLGHEADALAFLERLAGAPHRHDFYHTLRRLECLTPAKPRWGHAPRPVDEPVRLGQDPYLSFAPSSLASFEPPRAGRPGRLQVMLFGLLGPNGPLPTHFTEYARERLRHANDPTLARFLDLLQHRFIALFYRAWAQAQPHVNRDRPADDKFMVYVGAFAGAAHPRLRNRDAVPDVARLFHAGTLIRHTRNAEGLRAILTQFFRVPVRLQEFVGHWLMLGPRERTRLGEPTARLGRGAVIGGRVWDRQNSFRIHLGPLTLAQYEAFLPGGTRLPALVDWVRMYRNVDLDWDVRLRLDRGHVPALRLGRAGRLGWTTWLGRPTGDSDPDDLCLDAESFVGRGQSVGVGVPGEYQTL